MFLVWILLTFLQRHLLSLFLRQLPHVPQVVVPGPSHPMLPPSPPPASSTAWHSLFADVSRILAPASFLRTRSRCPPVCQRSSPSISKTLLRSGSLFCCCHLNTSRLRSCYEVIKLQSGTLAAISSFSCSSLLMPDFCNSLPPTSSPSFPVFQKSL